MRFGVLALSSLGAAMLVSPASAQEIAGNPQQGLALAQQWCSTCHLVGPREQSVKGAVVPSFAAVAGMPSTTQMSLQAFLQMSHPPMPDLKLTPAQIGDVTAYILSLRQP
jgi:mono/diheme cytochrome c family protein